MWGILETLRIGFIRIPFISMLVVAKDDERAKIIQSSLILHVLLTCIVVILLVSCAGLLAKFWRVENLEQLFYIYALNSFILIVFLHFEYFLQSNLEFKAIFTTNFIRLFLFLAYIFAYYVMGTSPSLIELALIQLGSTAIASFFSYQLVKGKIMVFILILLRVKFLRSCFIWVSTRLAQTSVPSSSEILTVG